MRDFARYQRALHALREAQRDAEKEATRLEISQPGLATGAAPGLTVWPTRDGLSKGWRL